MGKETRERIINNNRCLDILTKDKENITEDERAFLKKEYTGWGSVLGNTVGLAQFFTPDHVCKFIAEYLNPRLPENPKVLEPSAGVGALLNYIREDAEITCVEVEPSQCKILEYTEPSYEVLNISAGEFDRPNYYDLVIGNPPFNLTIETQKEWSLRKKNGKINSDELFLELAIQSAKEGGYIAFILPQSINYKDSLKGIRKLIYDTCWCIANISLPSETFARSGTNIPVTLLILRKAPKALPKVKTTNPKELGDAEFILGQPPVISIDITNIGYDKKGKLTPIDKDDEEFTQLDYVSDCLNDDLVFENICPEQPEWSERDKPIHNFICTGQAGLAYNYARNGTHELMPVMYNQLTLGRGCEIEFEGIEYSTMDWNVMNELIEKYKEKN
ncbi:HsdM family class I SAM-dependent methyltransferase [Romboutsia weinsteinii]|nr:N-6 DNA methylase [Romboutsia weinsteinii]